MVLLTAALVTSGLALRLRAADADSTPAQPSPPPSDTVENSVVKIFSTVRPPDFAKPWSKLSARESTGTGVVIEGKRILTNAHVVLYASQVQVQANQSGTKVGATVEAMAPGIDLAVLKLEDETFFDSRPALRRAARLPEIKDPVLVYGYPTGGTNLSITKGIVSRIDFATYNYPVSGLRLQIDAAINAGNSGGPAVVDNQVIGLAFSRLTSAQNIGYIIPCEEIELFLKDVADGRHDGKFLSYDDLQTFENPALRPFLKLDSTAHGIVVRRPFGHSADYPLKQWDLITKVGDTPVDDQGMVKVRENLRVRLGYLIQNRARNGKVDITVLRDGKEVALALPVRTDRPRLIPYLDGKYPRYFIWGPIAFTVATEDFVSSLTSGTTGATNHQAFARAGSPLATRRGDRPAFEGEELVMVSAPLFPHKTSKGYSNPFTRVVAKINGTAIRNLNHLVEFLRDAKDPFIAIEFAGHSVEVIVLPRAECMAATEEILSDNGVRAQGSPDTLAIWNRAAVTASAANTGP